MDWKEQYRKKLISADAAAGLVKSDMWIEYGFASGFPQLIDEAIAERAAHLERVKLRIDWCMQNPKVLECDPGQEHFIVNSFFITHGLRKYVRQGSCIPIPRAFGDAAKVYREHLKDRIDIAFITVTPMDKHGYFNFGAACAHHKALCEVAKTVVLEVNESQPWACGGYDEVIHISDVDYVVENHKHKIGEIVPPEPDEVQMRIAANVAEYIEDGATLQLGIGPIPNMICKVIAERGVKNLGIHSEMFTEGMLELVEAGIVNGKCKTSDKGKAVYTFAAGTRKLYDYIDHNPGLGAFPVEYVNDPFVIARNYKQFSLNSAIRIDLTGQVDAETIGTNQVSGSGGQLDFTRGAYRSPGGKAFIVLPSSYSDKKGGLHSNIVPRLDWGDAVTDPRNDVTYVGTEYGVVNLKGRSLWERAKLLISIAHPDFRADLEEEAARLNYLTTATRRLTIE
ncbi:MAG: acetyl-CoA hydrolase/transferase family protein [Ignavibacteriales bacterium]